MIVSWLLWSGIVDRVIILPVYAHAFDGIHDKKLASFEHRIHWCKLTFENCFPINTTKDPLVEISDLEKHLSIPSFTIDSLQNLQQQYPQDQLRLVIGSDSIPHLPKWKKWSDIEKHFDPIVVGRVGYPCQSEVFFPDISSTDIRNKLSQGMIPNQWIHQTLVRELSLNNPYQQNFT